MAIKRFGPVQDAGVVIKEKEANRTIQASLLGTTAYTGILERGPIGEMIECISKSDMLAKVGDLVPDSLLPDACQDFWDHSEGAGLLVLYRVTDGTEKKASLTSYDRKSPRNPVVTWEAKNGGGWAGRRTTQVLDLTTVPTDIAETTIDLPITFHPIQEDEFKGGTITLTGAGKSYTITGNAASTGTTLTTLTVTADSTMLTDYGISTNTEVVLKVSQSDAWGRDKNVAVEITDGQISPNTEWGVNIYVDGVLVKNYPDLSSDPAVYNYFAEVINEDPTNYYVTVTDLWSGAVVADSRPANLFNTIVSTEVAEKQVDLTTVGVQVDSSTAGTNTIASFTFGTAVIPDTYKLTYQLGTTDWKVESLSQQVGRTFPVALDTVAYVAANDYSIGFTITEAAPANGQYFTVTVMPLVEDEAINGRVFFPGQSWAPGTGWTISDNAELTADITSGDMTNGGAITGNVNVRLQYPQELVGGYDGIANVNENHFLPAFDIGLSEFNKTRGKSYGLIKFACPGINNITNVNTTVVEKAGISYVSAKNHQYRAEFAANVTDEIVARDYVNDTLGRSDYLKIIFPSYAKISDPVLSGRLKTVSLIGAVHGREAREARNFGGYHKVAAGTDVTFPRIRELTTGDEILNGELLNPVGIQRVEKKAGNFVIWGARIPSVDPAFRFCQHRELLSYYENVLLESFDYVIFAINDPIEQPGLIAALQSFFYPEWTNRALRGDSFEDACSIKIDDENNTDFTRSLGELHAEIDLRLADTIEKFIITIGKKSGIEVTSAA